VTRLRDIYASLPRPPSADGSCERVFSVARIEGYHGYYVARGDSDRPALIIEIAGQPRAPIVLQNLVVKFNAPCLLNLLSGRRSTNAAVIECLAGDDMLRQYFLTIAGHLLDQLGATPSPKEVAEAIDALVSLFQRLARPPRRETQGLFGELVIIEVAHNPAAMLNAWHADPFDRFDFVFGNARLEVKTNAGRRRSHEFSFEQCTPPPQTTATLASVFVETSGGGLSLQALIFRVEARLARHPSSVVKLHAVVADALGVTLPSALAQRFDEQLAVGSIAFYDLAHIPAVRGPVPPEVNSVRFRSDLDGISPMHRAQVAQLLPAMIAPF
jgi:Putative  PD-(D/E)XK family member, (DUF4420)